MCTSISLFFTSFQPVDAFFVLGGSIHREIYVAQLAKQYPQIPILISSGSPDSCILVIFQQEKARLEKVWLEKCAHSTWENFYYGIPILKSWRVHKVKLITSSTHLPRAQWMAQILFGSHRIWVESDIIYEKGVPANNEYWLKTFLDIIRSLFWAISSQIIQPSCPHITKLIDVNLSVLEYQNFHCEHYVKR